MSEEVMARTRWAGVLTVLRNGILWRLGIPPIVIINETQMSRDMGEVMLGGPSKAYTFPSTVTTVTEQAFAENEIVSVRLNDGLEILENNCFRSSGIRKLVLPSSVRSINGPAFYVCQNLEYADLSAARGLMSIDAQTFCSCWALKQVLLGDGLEIIGDQCFEQTGLESVSIPASIRYIGQFAFSDSSLTQVRFLGTTEKETHCEQSSENTQESSSDNEQHLVIGSQAFSECENLRQVIFDPDSTVREIQSSAFWYSGLESFIAPPSLRKIDVFAFRLCRNLKTFEINEGIQELGWLCLFGTGVTDLRLPQHVTMTRKQLGLDQDPEVLSFPHGLEVVEAEWFFRSDVERVFIPNTVRVLGEYVFGYCGSLREVVFESGSQLETIGEGCFSGCDLQDMTVPKSVRNIGDFAFGHCRNLRSLTFEEGSQLADVGKNAIYNTQLDLNEVKFPSTAQIDSDEETDVADAPAHDYVNGEEL